MAGKRAFQEAQIMGSPDFMYNTGAIVAGSSELIDFEKSNDISGVNRFGYAPFNNIAIFNASSRTIRAEINQDTALGFTVHPNSNQPLLFNGGIWSVRINNIESTGDTTSGQVRVSVSKTGTDSDTLSKKIAGWLFRG